MSRIGPGLTRPWGTMQALFWSVISDSVANRDKTIRVHKERKSDALPCIKLD